MTNPFVGRLGTVVGYVRNGRACFRTYRAEVNYPNTAAQQCERDWFVQMVRFAGTAKRALQLGLRHKAKEAAMTEGNLFIKSNKQHFHKEKGVVIIDYEQLQLADGAAADVYFRQPRFEEGEVLCVNYEKNNISLRANASDKVYLYVYAPELEEGVLSAPAERRDKQLKIKLPDSWSGKEVHVYGFVVDRDGRASRSTYIGVGRVNHYEDRGRYIPINKGWNDFVNMAQEANMSKPQSISNNEKSTEDEHQHIDLFGNLPPRPRGQG